MADEIEALRGVPLFSGMSDKDLRKVAEIAKVVDHSPGQLVVGEDNSAVGFHLILEGSAEAIGRRRTGRHARLRRLLRRDLPDRRQAPVGDRHGHAAS